MFNHSLQGDGDSEIALVVEDEDHILSYMDGRPYSAGRFAATLRRRLFRRAWLFSYKSNSPLDMSGLVCLIEHLGLIPPQNATSEKVTLSMRPAPVPNEDETNLEEDARVADPLSDELHNLLNATARVNREVFAELFHTVPSNLVRDWAAYEVRGNLFTSDVLAETSVMQIYKPKVKVGHVVPGISLKRVKDRLACVHGSIVEAPLVRWPFHLLRFRLVSYSRAQSLNHRNF